MNISLPTPEWNSSLANTIVKLEKLRSYSTDCIIPEHIFLELKNIFQFMETLASARIEGNRTTLTEYVDYEINKKGQNNNNKHEEKIKELENIFNAIEYIENQVDQSTSITEELICKIHKLVTDGLTRDGSEYSGKLRKVNVSIEQSKHTPPKFYAVPYHMEEFLNFINASYEEKNQLLMVAIAHHRFTYIHPFDNGNGRVGRLLNYALLIKLDFQVKQNRIINPSTIFHTNREQYYDKLAQADTLEATNLLSWCEYFLSGLFSEIEKIDKLLDITYVKDQVLLPAIKLAYSREKITKQEFKILQHILNHKTMTIKAQDLEALDIKTSLQKNRVLKTLRDKGILIPQTEKGRIYNLIFHNQYLLRSIIDVLLKGGFISYSLDEM